MTSDTPQAARLLDLVGQLGVRFGLERSFRLTAGTILPRRFLASISKASLAPAESDKSLALFQQLQMPLVFLASAANALPSARFLHFGYEQDPAGALYKVYLEMGVPRVRPDPLAPLLQHLAFKWDPQQPTRSAITRYVWHPALSPAAIVQRITQISPIAAPIATDLLQLAVPRMQQIRYMEATEDANPRRSFDLNIYDAGFTLRDIHPLLLRMCDACAISPQHFTPHYQPIHSASLGHIAGGIHRDGATFFNVYYGVQPRQG